MKTIVRDFCQAFSKELDPFASRLNSALNDLSGKDDLSRINPTLMSLREVQQRLHTLQEKIGGQQAFLLIFGPLKSGKSTLMNAISGAYVSEVSSLPAYPALVYVKNGDERRFHATTYEGKKREFDDNLEMANAVQQDHSRLASAILEVERAGEEFDPKQHYPEAIRRMDVEVPAKDLAESGSVLVDTPGLYSRMKFGYDQMTRDFRDTAACAIFVVKTDNLFFEKVFEEFEELLGCFSRIFLVTNIDKSRKDLRPDGTLEASLESRDPEKVIDAFRSLSMSAPLRTAIDDGRIRIYPIDLLEAASRRLQDGAGESPGEAAGQSDEEWPFTTDGAEAQEAALEAGKGEDGFSHFLDDLTGYLNSSDYLNDFMADSLRMARDLNREASELVVSEAADELRQSSRQLREGLEGDRKRLDALNQLEKMDWSGTFPHLYSEQDSLLGDQSQQVQKIVDNLQDELSQWMETNESWNDLLERRFKGYLAREASYESDAVLKQLRAMIDNAHGGARLSSAQLENFRQAGLRLEEIVPPLLRNLGRNVSLPSPRIELDTTNIPLKRTFSDYMMFRSSKQSRAQVFGTDGDAPIPSYLKQKRLAGSGIERLRESVAEFAREEWPRLQQDYVKRVMDGYVADFSQAVQRKVSELKTQLNRSVSETESKLKSRDEALKILEDIKSNTLAFDQSLDQMVENFGVSGNSGKAQADSEEARDEEADTVHYQNFDDNDNHLAAIEEDLRNTNN